MAGHRPYREFPLEWMERHLDKSGFEIQQSKKFSIMHSEASILRQLRVGQSKLGYMNPAVRIGYEAYFKDLEYVNNYVLIM
jgi:hypothetical protein